MANQLVALIPGADLTKVTDAFTLSTYDEIYNYLTSASVNGPELLDITNNSTQDMYIRMYSAIASAPITANSLSEGRADLVQSVLDLIAPTVALPRRLVDKFNDLYADKQNSLNSSFVLPTGTTLTSEGLDRLNQVTQMVGAGSSSDLLAANNLSTNSVSLLSSLRSQNVVSDAGVLLNSLGQPVQKDGASVVISDYQSLTDHFIDPNLNSFTEEFLTNDSITGELARNITLNEVTDLVVKAADTVQTPEVISTSLNNLLAAVLELDPEADSAKSEASKLLKLSLSVSSLTKQRPLFELDSNGDPKTVFDPKSNTDVFVYNKVNQKFYQSALDQQDVLQADYVGLTLDQWRDLDNQPNASKVKADRINAVKIGISYADYVNFATLDPTDSTAWSIYPFAGYQDSGKFDSGDFKTSGNVFANPQAALDNLLSSSTNKGVSYEDFSNLFSLNQYLPQVLLLLTRSDYIKS